MAPRILVMRGSNLAHVRRGVLVVVAVNNRVVRWNTPVLATFMVGAVGGYLLHAASPRITMHGVACTKPKHRGHISVSMQKTLLRVSQTAASHGQELIAASLSDCKKHLHTNNHPCIVLYTNAYV